MTTHASDDELSGHLDGVADAGVDAHLRGCDVCRRRLDQLAQAAAAVAAPPWVDEARRESAVAAALAAAPTGVAHLPAHPRRDRWRAAVGGLAAAALVAVAALGVGALGGDADHDDSAADAPAEALTGGAAEDSGVAGGPAAGAIGAPAPGGPRWLGDLGDLDGGTLPALERAATRQDGGQDAGGPAPPPPSCEGEARAAGAAGPLTAYGAATLRGAEVRVLQFAGEPGAAVVVSAADCRVLAREPLG